MIRPASATLLALSAVASPAQAAPVACDTLVCAYVTEFRAFPGSCGAPSQSPYPHRHCEYMFSYGAHATAITPGSLQWETNYSDGMDGSGSCSWILPGGCSTGVYNTGWRVAAVPCGGSVTVSGYEIVTAASGADFAVADQSASVTLTAAAC